MDILTPVFELIDLRSFSNLWFWIALAVMWSTASHFVLGVPYDMVLRARRKGGQPAADLHDMIAIQARRIDYVASEAGVIIVAVVGFSLTTIAIMGFAYGVEFAQALLLLAFPMSVVWLMRLATARRILRGALVDAALYAALTRHRFWIQLVGLVSIFTTAMWGMYQNLEYSPLGN